MSILVKTRARLVAVGLTLAIVVGLGVWFFGFRTPAYAVIVKGKEIARVKNVRTIDTVVAELEKEEGSRIKSKVQIATPIKTDRVSATREELDTASELKKELKGQVSFKTRAVWVIVDGKKVLAVKDKTIGRQLLEQLRQGAASVGQGEKLIWTRFDQKVAFLTQEVDTRQVVDQDQAMKILTMGSTEPLHYKVKQGDTLWDIAQANHTYVADLWKANHLKSENLQLDQELIIPTSHPYVTVVAAVEGTRIEDIPYETKVITDRNLASRRIKVKQEGQEGSKRVTYLVVKSNGNVVSSRIIAENIIKQPVDKIVAKGTRAVYRDSYQVASRGLFNFNLGSGWLWPVFGHITCSFGGYRGHTGMDIGAKIGTPVKAAKSGTVIFAGYSGGYGNNIVISHGGGVQTRYAHLSKIYVKKGEKISGNEVIGAVGVTGHTTGPHLHFEVIKNGGFINPISVLR